MTDVTQKQIPGLPTPQRPNQLTPERRAAVAGKIADELIAAGEFDKKVRDEVIKDIVKAAGYGDGSGYGDG